MQAQAPSLKSGQPINQVEGGLIKKNWEFLLMRMLETMAFLCEMSPLHFSYRLLSKSLTRLS